MKVLFVCCAGMSTSLLVERVRQSAANRKIEMEINATSEAEARKNLDQADVIFLGPQVRYLEKSFAKDIEGKDIKLGIADMVAYGRLDGDKILDQILELLNS